MIHEVTILVLQLAVLTVGAMLLGHVAERALRLPRVLGELSAGLLAGPYTLGGIHIAALGRPLFELHSGQALPISVELYGIAVLASIVLLFLSGLETDLPTFLRFSAVGGAVGIGGVVGAFALGAGSAVLFLPGVTGFGDPQALFLGVLATATSVGITARILSERRKMSSPEGVTILAAAVLDDVIGIVLLAVVVGLARVTDGAVDWPRILRIAARAFGFWLGTTVVGIIVAPWLVRGLKRLQSLDVIAGVAFGIALLLSGLAELAGLAMIIGAYVAGLALSRTDVADEIRDRLQGLYSFLVPLFFAVMGLLVDFRALAGVLGFGLLFTTAVVLGKFIGCGVPALVAGFNARGALRIGAGMQPRGEVTLIAAGIGLSAGAIGPDLFGVSAMTLLVSSVIAPPLLIAVFRGGSGYRRERADADRGVRSVQLPLPNEAAAEFLRARIIDAFRSQGYFVSRVDINSPIYRIRHEDIHITMIQKGSDIALSTPARHEQMVRLLLLEELVDLKDLIGGLEALRDPDELGDDLVGGMFSE